MGSKKLENLSVYRCFGVFDAQVRLKLDAQASRPPGPPYLQAIRPSGPQAFRPPGLQAPRPPGP